MLALQGGFDAHLEALNKINSVTAKKVTSVQDLDDLQGLVIPGGESSTFLKLLELELKEKLINKIKKGLPVFGTCAGLILLAKNVENPKQESLAALDIDVQRNAYGRQLESFETSDLVWQKDKKKADFNAIFIRAPKITRIGESVEVLLSHNDEAVLVRSGNILGATFHPELNKEDNSIHQYFVSLI